jgi:hypothetical protein
MLKLVHENLLPQNIVSKHIAGAFFFVKLKRVVKRKKYGFDLFMLALDDRIFTKYYHSQENKESEMAIRVACSGSE